MEEKGARAAILRVFEKHRQKPGDSFTEEEFLANLMEDAGELQDVRNGFAGLRRLNAFYDELQLECAVCLEDYDMERNWPVDGLAGRIVQKKQNNAAQKGLVKKRMETAERGLIFEPLKFGLFLILPAICILWGFVGGWTAGFVLFALGGCVVFGIYNLQRKEIAYCKRLLEEISRVKVAAQQDKPPK